VVREGISGGSAESSDAPTAYGAALGTARVRAGVTLVELALGIAIMGILAAVAAPRFFSKPAFEEAFFVQDVVAALRYAQKLAVASGCDVRVSFTPPGGYALAQMQACRAGPFSQPVANPGTGEPSYSNQAPAGTALASSVDPLIFDALGRARDAALAVSDATVTVGGTTLTVVGETGFAFDPAS
jgi:MSHA pilin protein MshC